MIESMFRELVRYGGVESVHIDAAQGGYLVKVLTATGQHHLTLHRGGDRVFKTVDSAASVVLSAGFESAVLSLVRPKAVEQPKVVPPPASKRTPPAKKKRQR